MPTSVYAVESEDIDDGDIVRPLGESNLYYIEGDRRRRIPTAAAFEAFGLNWSDIQAVPAGVVSEFSSGDPLPEPSVPAYSDGSLVKGSGPGVFLIENGTRRVFPDAYTFEMSEHKSKEIQVISDITLSAIPLGSPLPQISPPRTENIIVKIKRVEVMNSTLDDWLNLDGQGMKYYFPQLGIESLKKPRRRLMTIPTTFRKRMVGKYRDSMVIKTDTKTV